MGVLLYLSLFVLRGSDPLTGHDCPLGVSRVRMSSGRSRANVSSLSDLVAAGKWGAGRPGGGRLAWDVCISPHRVVIVDCYSAKSCLIDGNNCF